MLAAGAEKETTTGARQADTEITELETTAEAEIGTEEARKVDTVITGAETTVEAQIQIEEAGQADNRSRDNSRGRDNSWSRNAGAEADRSSSARDTRRTPCNDRGINSGVRPGMPRTGNEHN